ncbi:hypothetical protein [uncultured Eubacterium sp.]|uniref:hypothetical protein n=1 Tax=uncultured Eubacterium sp. TaxID=165185 RepID=UPI0025F92EEC|nr:hypothetical protein [uncultured Eubacterium sp.]
MKQLTFVGFLKSYLCELSLCESSSITKLCKEADHNLRLIEPLTLFIKMTKNEEQQNKIKCDLVKEELNQLQNINNVELALKNKLLSTDYQKVYNSYLVKIKKKEKDNRTKKLMLARIKELQEKNNISNYRIYTDLKLNQGNINDYLANENVNKLSVATAKKILDYVSA